MKQQQLESEYYLAITPVCVTNLHFFLDLFWTLILKIYFQIVFNGCMVNELIFS